MDAKNNDLVFRYRSSNDCHEDSTELINLFRRCETTKQASPSMSTTGGPGIALFHCEFTDYLANMEQYLESYCFEMVQPTDGRILAAYITNLKELYFGEHLMTAGFSRLVRVDPSRRRHKLAQNLMKLGNQVLQLKGFDIELSSTLTTNSRSLNMQRSQTELLKRKCVYLTSSFYRLNRTLQMHGYTSLPK
jgi:hypothetical protein